MNDENARVLIVDKEIPGLLSGKDSLTGISNRRQFDRFWNTEWSRALRYQHHITLILIDIDFFKYYNDYYGQAEGDVCIKNIARSVSLSVPRTGDFVARYDGEKFACILPETDEKGALVVANRILESVHILNIPHLKSEVSDHVTVSIGIATAAPTLAGRALDLVKIADKALGKAKQKGRNQIVYINSIDQHREEKSPQGRVKQKILIVDDEKINIDVLVGLLKPHYPTVVAKNGWQTLNRLEKSPLPALILLDIMMPEMDGYQVCRRLKENKKTAVIPVIFISSLDEPIDKMKAFKAGGVDYVTKPFFAEEVLARVNVHIRLREAQQLLEKQNENLQEANYQLRQRQNTIIRLLGDVSKIKLSGERHAIRNLAQKVFERQKSDVLKNMADQSAILHQICQNDEQNTIFITEACRIFGIDPALLANPAKVADQLRNIDLEAKNSNDLSKCGDRLDPLVLENIDSVFSDLFSDVILLDDAYNQFMKIKNTSDAWIAKHFDPFTLFYSLRRLYEFIAQINQRFGQYKSMEFIQPLKLSYAIESATDQAMADKGKTIRVLKDFAYDPVLQTNVDAISSVLRDLIYNAIDAGASTVKVISRRPSEERELPVADQWMFEDYPALYIRFEDNGKGLSRDMAGWINDYLNGRFDDQSSLSTKGKNRGGMGTKNLRDFLVLHKGYCHYQFTDTGVWVHIYLEKLEI
ncbi:diguanylate cyclase [Desulfococcaceae bacterium HSG7]|nr:diguanylate cyclase [Desulfococcaceae bacterium HSG7]